MQAVGSYAFGVSPSFDMPITVPLPAVNERALGKPLTKLINSLDLLHRLWLLQAFQALQNLDSHLTTQYLDHGSTILEEPLKIDTLVDPVARKFLVLESPADELNSGLAAFSCLRAAALLYIAELRRRSGISPVITAFQVNKLKDSINAIDDHPALDWIMRLWLLTVGALESMAPADQRYFCCQIKRLRLEFRIETITQFREHLGQVVWFGVLFEPRLSALFRLL